MAKRLELPAYYFKAFEKVIGDGEYIPIVYKKDGMICVRFEEIQPKKPDYNAGKRRSST